MTAPQSHSPVRATEDPRLELLSRVTRHLEEHGIDGQSLRAIATGADTSHRMLIYHFGSRDGLLSAVVDGLWQRLHEEFLEQMTTAETTGVRDAALRFWSSLEQSGTVAPLFCELSASAMRGAPWAGAFRVGATGWNRQLADSLAVAGMSRQDAEVLARTTLYVVRGALWEAAITDDRDTVDSTVRTFLTERWPGTDAP